MRHWKILTQLLLTLLLAIAASGPVSAKLASGPQNLSPGLHQAETVLNSLWHQGIIESSYDDPSGSSVVAKGPLWTSTKSKSAVENAFGHYKKHKSEFPEFQNAKQYVEGTRKFLNSPPKGTLTKTRSNGDSLLYDPKTNTFGVKDANGAPRTMFRPKDGLDYWNKQ